MRQARHRQSDSAEKTVRNIRRATRRRFSAEDKIRIVLEGLRGEDTQDMTPHPDLTKLIEGLTPDNARLRAALLALVPNETGVDLLN